MFLIDNTANSIQKLQRKSFTELGYKERTHLQEWIAGNPSSLGEKLLIIQKEFSGFAETYERLDLLALDAKGNLVIIENKLDDSGKDVTWQALKYASYCSTLTKEEIRNVFQSYLDSAASGKNAVDQLEEFFDGKAYSDLVLNQGLTQRIFLVAANFRKEVTSTTLWLRNFKIQVHCFKATVYGMNDQNFLTLEQIIPTKDAQDYIISITNKVQEDISTEEELQNRHKVRLEFWAELLKQIKGKSPLFQNSNPTKDHWLVAGGTNISGLSYQFVITMTNAQVQMNFGRSSTEENKLLFDALKVHQTLIEENFGSKLNWERLDDKKSSRLSFTLPGVNYFVKEDWQKIARFLIEHINKLEAVTKPYLVDLKKLLTTSEVEIEEVEI
jgi:hypothetical protein